MSAIVEFRCSDFSSSRHGDRSVIRVRVADWESGARSYSYDDGSWYTVFEGDYWAAHRVYWRMLEFFGCLRDGYISRRLEIRCLSQ